MGCEGGVTIYDAEAIENQFGTNVWEASGWGAKWAMPIVELGGHRYCVTDFNSCDERAGGGFSEAADEWWQVDAGCEPGQFALWNFNVPDEKRAFAREVAKWACANAELVSVETWT